MVSGNPTLKRVLLAAAGVSVLALTVVTLIQGFSLFWPLRVAQGIALFVLGAVVVGGLLDLAVRHLADWREPASEEEFDALVVEAERLARENLAAEPSEEDFLALDPVNRDDFDELVAEALDQLPRDFQLVLKHVPVVVSDGGRKRSAYGLYQGDGVARDMAHDRIVIFRDTLVRDFGHDPDRLREEVTRTVLHELAHHLGWDEPGVRGLGL